MKEESSLDPGASYRNIKNGESVNLSPEDVAHAAALWNDPDFVLRFVDIICAFDDGTIPPS